MGVEIVVDIKGAVAVGGKGEFAGEVEIVVEFADEVAFTVEFAG